MVDKALSAAQAGLIDAQSRANRLAREIVNTASGARVAEANGPSFAAFTVQSNPDPLSAFSPEETGGQAGQGDESSGTGRPLANPLTAASLSGGVNGDGGFVRSIVEFKVAEVAFNASATLFSRLDDLSDQLIDRTEDETA